MATAYPPTVHHETARIDHATALSLLQNFLAESLTSPHLHPDALLTERGPQVSGSSEDGGLVLHHLRRVEAGIRGDLEFEGVNAVGANGHAAEPALQRISSEAVEVLEGESPGEWQDMETYKREQEIEQGELGDIATGSVVEGGEVPMVRSTGGTAISKEERKKAKQQRQKEEKREKEERRKREREMEMEVDG